MSKTIEIVNRGRGFQLSTSRVTVQDLVPYFLEGCSYEEIVQAIPSLTHEEIAVVEQYFLNNKEELLEQDWRIKERAAARQNPPEAAEASRKARRERLEQARQMIRQQQARNGDQTPG
jgi:hypothetical protein